MHIEFPRCLHGAGGTTLIVHNEEDRDRELANGWSLRPVPDAPVAETVAEPVIEDAAPKPRKRKETVN